MKIAVMKEIHAGEKRVPLIPPTVDKLVKLGAQVEVESGLGLTCRYEDADYEKVGATISSSREEMLASADMVLRLRKPPMDEIEAMKKGCIHVSYLDPFNEVELVDKLKEAGISAVSLEMIPRTTVAQKMDVLSSQANLGGYVAVILAAEQLDKILPMMTTPAGTIKPAHVFIIGVGVAGLQAIATAKKAHDQKTLMNAQKFMRNYTYNHAVIAIQANKTSEAEKYLNASISYGNNSPDVYYELGKIYRKKGKYTEALNYLQKALSLDQGTEVVKAKYYYSIGKVYENMNKKAEACAAFKKALHPPYEESAKYELTQVLKCK